MGHVNFLLLGHSSLQASACDRPSVTPDPQTVDELTKQIDEGDTIDHFDINRMRRMLRSNIHDMVNRLLHK